MSQFIFTEKRLTDIVRTAVNDAFKAEQKDNSAVHPNWEYIPSILHLSRFLGCPYQVAKRLRREGRIRGTFCNGRVRFFIPDVISAIESDPVIQSLFIKVCNRINGLAEKGLAPEVMPRATVESELCPEDELVMATLRYQGWKCDICLPEHFYGNTDKVERFVNKLILSRHKRHPFPIPPQC